MFCLVCFVGNNACLHYRQVFHHYLNFHCCLSYCHYINAMAFAWFYTLIPSPWFFGEENHVLYIDTESLTKQRRFELCGYWNNLLPNTGSTLRVREPLWPVCIVRNGIWIICFYATMQQSILTIGWDWNSHVLTLDMLIWFTDLDQIVWIMGLRQMSYFMIAEICILWWKYGLCICGNFVDFLVAMLLGYFQDGCVWTEKVVVKSYYVTFKILVMLLNK